MRYFSFFTRTKRKKSIRENNDYFYICSFLFFFCDKKEKKRNQRKEKERKIKRAFTVFEQKFHLTRSCKFLLKSLKSLTKGFARQGHKPLYFFKIIFKPVLYAKEWVESILLIIFSFTKKKEKYQRKNNSILFFYIFISFLLNCVGKRKERQIHTKRGDIPLSVFCIFKKN